MACHLPVFALLPRGTTQLSDMPRKYMLPAVPFATHAAMFCDIVNYPGPNQDISMLFYIAPGQGPNWQLPTKAMAVDNCYELFTNLHTVVGQPISNSDWARLSAHTIKFWNFLRDCLIDV